MAKFTFELEVEVEGTFRPGRPATMYCRNGDPGDPPEPDEIEVSSVTRLGVVRYDRERKRHVTHWFTMPASMLDAFHSIIINDEHLLELAFDAVAEEHSDGE